MKTRFLLYIFSLLLIIESVLGYSITSYNSSFDIVGNKVLVTLSLEFDEEISDVFVMTLPAKYEKLEVYLDDKPFEPSFDGNSLSLKLTSTKLLSLKYETSEYLDKSSFLLDTVLPANTSNLEMVLSLPEGFILREQLKEDDPGAGSIYPKPHSAFTDGKRIIFLWRWENLSKSYEIPIYIQYKKGVDFLGYVLPVIVLFAILGILSLALILLKKSRSTSDKEKISKHLKEDEEAIVNILKQREGRMCEQGTLRVITGMPKASLSRLLKELEERKVVYKEKRGKKNLVFLKD